MLVQCTEKHIVLSSYVLKRSVARGFAQQCEFSRLESQLPRADSDVTIITHCSASHLDRLEKMCFQWTGVVVAAVIADGDRRVDRLVRQLAAAVHSRVESGGWGLCRLDICLCQTAPGPAARDGLYPINALRNVAFDAARTELVLLLVRYQICSADVLRMLLLRFVILYADNCLCRLIVASLRVSPISGVFYGYSEGMEPYFCVVHSIMFCCRMSIPSQCGVFTTPYLLLKSMIESCVYVAGVV